MKDYRKILEEANAKIWDASELKFEEYISMGVLCDLLEGEGFKIQKGLADMPTAFTAVYGEGKPVIGILAEYDALSGLSQEAGIAYKKNREGTNNGHGCGHSLLGTASAGAAIMMKERMEEEQLPGTVVLVGCPAEEGGSGKAYLARAGVFDGLDLALTWHPGGGNAVLTGSMQANCQVYFRFKGVSAHAAGCPHLGRSALDAVELMDVGVNYMREHIEPTDRVHYAILDTGGVSPNVVQNHAEVVYLIRSTTTEKVQKLYERVCKIAKGAAMMTETEVEIDFDKACSNIISNEVLEQLLYGCMLEEAMPQYTEEELAFAGAVRDTYGEPELAGDMAWFALGNKKKKQVMERAAGLCMADFVVEHQHLDISIPGSSDVGDCSHVVPTAQFVGACFAPGTPAHSWQAVAQGKSGTAVKGMLYAAGVLARAGMKALKDPQIIAKAKEAFQEDTEGKPYVCPIPAEIKPNSRARK